MNAFRTLRDRLLPVALLLPLLLAACGNDPEVEIIELSGPTMGTQYRITLIKGERSLPDDLQQQVDDELNRISSLMSTYDPDSQLSLFNQQRTTEWVAMAPETIELIRQAKRISEATGGAFDIAIGSISRMWGFGPGANPDSEVPGDDELFMAMNQVGYQLLSLSPYNDQVRKLSPELEVDLSAIAKGYGVDQIGLLLEGRGIERYLVDIGGEIRTRGLSERGKPWLIGIEWPDGSGQGARGLAVENAHIATSGDYRNYQVVNGRRISHLIDGRTGAPIEHTLASVTVLHGSVAQADAWATALMILGPSDALKLATRLGLAASFTSREGDRFNVTSTEGFKAYLSD